MSCARPAWVMVATASMTLISACSVLRIDVDVYKGPLANEPTVQDEALPVMLTSAKTGLLRLRNDLDRGIPLRQQSDWIPNYFMEAPRGPDARLGPAQDEKKAARAVNALLYLYKDEGTPEQRPFLSILSERVPAYSAATHDLEGLDDTTLWPKWYAAMIAAPSGSALEDCKQAFGDYFSVIFAKSKLRTADQVRALCPKLLQGDKRLSATQVSDAKFPDDYSSNQVYAKLENQALVDVYTSLLFADVHSAPATQFEAAVIRKAHAFRVAREQLRAIWLSALDALDRYDSLNGTGKPDDYEIQVAKLIARLTDVGYLLGEFCRESPAGPPLLRNLESIYTADHGAAFQPWDVSHFEVLVPQSPAEGGRGEMPSEALADARNSLKKALLTNAHQTIQQLREADEQFRRAGWVDPHSCPYFDQHGETRAVDSREKRRYGILDGPLVTDRDLVGPEEFSVRDISAGQLSSAAQLITESQEGFENGRLPEGISTIVNNYLLRLRDGTLDGDSPEAAAERTRLRTAAVQFAEKLLLLTNSELLFPNEDKKFWRSSSVTNVLTGRRSAYVSVLQATANGILVQAQELDAYTHYVQSGRDQAGNDRLIATNAQTEGALQYVNLLLTRASAVNAATPVSDPNKPAAVVASQGGQSKKAAKRGQAQAPSTSATQTAAAEAVEAAYEVIIDPKNGFLAEAQKASAVTPSAVRDAIVSSLSADLSAAGNDKQKPDWTKAKQYLQTATYPSAPAEKDAKSAYSQLVTLVRKASVAAKQAAASAHTTVAQNQPQAAPQNGNPPAVAAAVKNESPPKAGNPDSCSPTSFTGNDVRQAIAVALPDLFKVLDSSPGARSANSAYIGLVEIFTQNCKAGGATREVSTQSGEALAFVKANPPVNGVDQSIPATSPGTHTSSIDSVITALRFQQIEAIRTNDVEGQKALQGALEAAYNYRSSLVYIRPASAYLRSAYPATVYQQQAGVAWQNLLQDEGRRGLPFFSQTFVNETFPTKAGSQNVQKILAAEENDRESWQNINSVKVSGAALTNYVVTKDDVGNWYVKSYSANPDKILEAATKLAQFNLGVPNSALPTKTETTAKSKTSNSDASNVVSGTGKSSAGSGAGATSSDSGSGAAQKPATGVQSIVNKYQSNYQTTTTSDLDRARKLDTEWADAIKQAWATNATLSGSGNATALAAFQTSLTSVAAELTTRLAPIQEKPTAKSTSTGGAAGTSGSSTSKSRDSTKVPEVDEGAQILAAWRAVEQSYRTLVSTLKDDKQSTDATNAATAIAARATRDLLTGLVKSRESAVKTYATAVTVLGQGG